MNSEKIVQPVNVKSEMSLNDLISQFEGSGAFGAGRLSEATKIFEKIASDREALKFLGLAGAMVPAGMRRVVVDMIREGYINVIVSTGANLTHDLIEAFGGHHIRLSKSYSDIQLNRLGINRIYDIYVKNSEFVKFEKNIQKILEQIDPAKLEKGIAVYELLWEIGGNLTDNDSIIKNAFEKKVPVFCPAITDSILGLQLWLFRQRKPIVIDVLKDIQKMIDMAYESKRAAVISIGGGVPKNHILQTMLITGRGFDYAIQITMDRPEPGGLSGASLSEAQSWGKIKSDAPWVDLIADATIVLPIIVGAVKERLAKSKV
ncbi:MAG: deoxyhypusine synthase [Candidatus Odinarchaeum yellowstonii]|uniref:Probable deoxyhypusine synthase n=1 Tax=Odinarchaeota yellowstonii (strain LCB_4) TaxID=1841599 RepID=A0AAF0IC74_ODILC|nr:MAG: deoxyhypusine synthase [Candidatus Odinarchaeum yellowstonii]